VFNINEKTIESINKGDSRAFEELYSTYYVYLCAVATKYIYNAEIAKEITNDVFLSVWNNHGSIKFPVKPYLIRAVKNRCHNYIQRQRLEQEVSLSEVHDHLLHVQDQQIELEPYPLACLENKEFEEMISKAVNTLPPRCRSIFEQYLYQNKSYEEIARANNISQSTVRVQIKLGLSKLKDLLGDYYGIFILIFNFLEK